MGKRCVSNTKVSTIVTCRIVKDLFLQYAYIASQQPKEGLVVFYVYSFRASSCVVLAYGLGLSLEARGEEVYSRMSYIH